MEKYFFFLFILLGTCIPAKITAQGKVMAEEDSLEIFLERDDLKNYFRKLTQLGDSAYVNSDPQQLIALSQLLLKEFEISDKTQRKALRSAAMRIGSKVWNLTGDYNAALTVLLVAHENVENKEVLDSLTWYIENSISAFYTMKGDYEKAEYFSTLVEHSLTHYGMINLLTRYYTNLGRKLLSEFKTEEAVAVFEKGLHLADSIDYNTGVFANAINLAEVYNDYPEMGSAQLYLETATTVLPKLQSDNKFPEKKSILYFENAEYQNLLGHYAESIRLYKEAILTLEQFYSNTNRREFAKYYYALARVYRKIDSLEMAEAIISKGLASLVEDYNTSGTFLKTDQLYAENSFIDLFQLQSQIHEDRFSLTGDYQYLEKALKDIELALHVNDLIRASVIADPSKLISIRNNRMLISQGISIIYQLYKNYRNDLYLTTARSFFDRSKSLLYNEKTKRNRLIGLLTESDQEYWSSLQKTIRELQEKKFEPGANINLINGELLIYEERTDKLFSAYRNNAGSEYIPDQYIEYFMSDSSIYSFSFLDNHTNFIELGNVKDFRILHERLNEFILLKGLSMDVSILNDLYAFLIKPVATGLPANFVVIPDGIIGYIPFEMLENEHGEYLMNHSTISYSYECVTNLYGNSSDAKKLSVFCLAPKYKARQLQTGELTRGSIYDLPYAKMEVDSICNLFGEAAFQSQSDQKQEWEHAVENARIFHYAGHAIISGDKAYLALNESEEEKQQLTGREIGIGHHALDLVVLSACETGLGKMEQGEGIRSLGKSFMESGTKATLISLWNVNDKSTATIMVAFYKYLKEGLRKDEALRQSKLDYIRTVPTSKAHPYFWAAFIPAGDMNPLN